MVKNRFQKKDLFVLTALILISLTLRLYKINAPLSDAYSWRQADTAAVARNFVRDGFNLLEPRYDDLSSIQSGLENPNGIRFVEAPIYNSLFALLYKIAPIVSIEVYGRMVSIFFSLLILTIIYYFLLKEHSRTAAVFGALVFSIMPAFVFFSRVVLPETAATAYALLSIFFLYIWHERTHQKFSIIFYVASLIFFAIGLLIKPTVIFFSITLLYFFVSKYKYDLFKHLEFYMYFLISIIPLILWRMYIQSHPEGIPSSEWLIGMVNTFEGQKNIFFKPAFFRWIFYERINVMILGGFLTPFVIAGIFTKLKRLFLYTILFSCLAYLFVFEGGNVQHEYYQTLILPALAIFSGLGVATYVTDKKPFVHPIIIYPVIVFLFILSFSFSYYYKVRDFYTYPADLNQMAKIIDTFTQPTDKVITDRMGDTTLLYLSDRKGAPMLYKSLDELKNLGYSYYLTDKKEIISELKIKNQYPILFENTQFAFFKL